MKMKMFAVLYVIAALVCGCGATVMATDRKPPIYQSNGAMYVWCDYHKGVEYIGFNGGMSVRYNEDGTLSKCDKG